MPVAKCYSTFSNTCSVPASIVFLHFIVTVQRGNNIFTFYRRRAARKQYLCHFIVTVQRGNNIFTFYCRRAAREQYLCHFIVTVQRGNNIFAILSSPCSAETIFSRFSACSVTASIKIFVFIFAERRCVFGMVGAVPVCPPERLRSGVSIPKYIYASHIMHEDLTMDAPLQGDTGGHIGTAPTTLRNIFTRNPTQTK